MYVLHAVNFVMKPYRRHRKCIEKTGKSLWFLVWHVESLEVVTPIVTQKKLKEQPLLNQLEIWGHGANCPMFFTLKSGKSGEYNHHCWVLVGARVLLEKEYVLAWEKNFFFFVSFTSRSPMRFSGWRLEKNPSLLQAQEGKSNCSEISLKLFVLLN